MLTTSFDVTVTRHITTDLAPDVYYAGELTLQFDVTVSGGEDGWVVQRIELLSDGTDGIWANRKWSPIPKGTPLYAEALTALAEKADDYDDQWTVFLESEGLPPFDPHAEYGTDNLRRL